MAENVMSFANGNANRGVLAYGKADLVQSATSPKKAPALATLTDTARSPLVNRSKPKQPYLKRGTGLQNRLVAAKQKRYIPKGGFIKGQTEDEGGQLRNPGAVNAEHITHSTALSSHQNKPHYDDLSREVFEASRFAGSSSEAGEQYMTSEAKPAPHNHEYGQFAHRQQADGFGAAQFHANADVEAELDADTALVHFPHQAHTEQGRQAHGNYHKQHFQESCESEDVLQNSMSSLARPHAPANVPDWQVQQAAEALELEEFRALERQITQDSGSVRGSVASLSSVPTWQRHTSSTAIRKSRGLNHMSQQHQQPHVHAMHHPQSVLSQLSETNELLLEHVQGVRQAAQQRPPPRVTGNPFADPEEGSTYDDDDDSHHPASVAAQQEPANDKLSSNFPVSALPHTYNVPGQQQSFSYPEFEAESAWDASSVAAAPVATSNEESQDMLQAENASQKYIQQMFRRQQPEAPAEKPSSQPKELETEAIAALEQEMKALKDDRAQVSKLRTQLEQASVRMEQEKAAWKRQQSDETAAWEAEKEAENQRLKRHQRVLDKQSRALLKLPNRKERSEVEAVEAVLEQERKASNAKDARHKLTVERLRQKLVELQDTNAELREEIRFHEQRRLEEWNAKENQQPKAGSRGKAEKPKRSEAAAASTNRSSKTEQSLEEASSQSVMRPPQGVRQEAPGRRSQMHAPLFGEAQHLAAGAMHPASQAEGSQDDGNDEEADEAIYREDAGPMAESWQEQSQAAWVQADMAQHEQGARVLPPTSLRHHAEHEWQSISHQGNFHMPESHPSSQPVTRAMDAFQPIVNMRLPSTSDHGSSSAFTGPQQARQPANMPVDRYQHATVLASPDDFVWQPIRPQTSQQYVDPAAASQPTSMADMSDTQESTWTSHVAPPVQSGHYSRSLRESLDAAACLDSRLQMAQQQKQQQQQQSRWAMLDSQWQNKPGQNESMGKDTVGSSASWQNLQEPLAADHPAAPQHAATHKQQQQPLSSADRQPQREAMPLIDRSGPQVTAPLPGKQGQYHMQPEASSSAGWLPSHAAESDAALEAGLYSSQRPSQHDSWVAEAGPKDWNHHAASNGTQGEASVPEPAAGSAPQRPYQELNYPDGKVERVFPDGRRSVLFANGTRKQHFPDGHTTIRFTNNDIKRFFHCGRVEYYYCEVDTWHTTHANGIEVFYFPNGQTEAHHPSGTKEIIFPDGIIRRVFTDGREQEVTTEQLSSPVKHPIPEDKD